MVYNVILRKGTRDRSNKQAIITGRNEVVAKVMFLHVSVILFTGGVSGEPPQTRENPLPDQGDTPLGPRRTPWDQGEPPGTRENKGRPLPPGKKTAAYGQ